MHQSVPDHLDPKTLILIWDTGGSVGLTPFRSNFIDYVELVLALLCTVILTFVT